MAATRYSSLTRQGWLVLGLLALGAGLIMHYFGPYWSLPLWLGCALALFAFRDPDREIPPAPLAVVSPADGHVAEVANVRDPYLDRDAIRVAIQMHPYGVFTTRSPVEGKILEPRNIRENGMPYGVWLRTDEGDDLVVVMNRGPLGNAPRCYVGIGERVGQGQRCGFVHLGSRIDVYLPLQSRVNVGVGAAVKGGADTIATLVHK